MPVELNFSSAVYKPVKLYLIKKTRDFQRIASRSDQESDAPDRRARRLWMWLGSLTLAIGFLLGLFYALGSDGQAVGQNPSQDESNRSAAAESLQYRPPGINSEANRAIDDERLWQSSHRPERVSVTPADADSLVWQSKRLGSPSPQPDRPIVISANDASKWREGQYDVWHLIGPCVIEQGATKAMAHEAVLWIDPGDPYIGEPDRLIVYLEGNAEVDFQTVGPVRAETGRAAQTIKDERWLGRFVTMAGLQMNVIPSRGKPEQRPGIYDRGWTYHGAGIDPSIQPTQFVVPSSPQGQPLPQSFPGNDLPGGGAPAQNFPGVAPGTGRPPQTYPPGSLLQGGFPQNGADGRVTPTPQTIVDIGPRAASVDFNTSTFPSADGSEQITIADRGVKITIQSSQLGQIAADSPLASSSAPLDTVVILADRVVAWSRRFDEMRSGGGSGEQQWELYLEGNIVFAFAERVIYADRMYYDANNQRGTILNAEMLTPVPDYEGLVRLRAEILQQVDRETFQAYQAAITSSRLGYPRYWLQSGNVTVRHNQIPLIDPFSGQVATDPNTGQQLYDHVYNAESRNNFVYLNGFPVFYWPTIVTDLQDPTFYLTGLSVKNDGVYGTQVLADFDLYQVLGIRNAPEGTDWELSTDYMSDRGFGLGTEFKYEGTNLFGFSGPYRGRLDAWGINDSGLDNLGIDRRALVPEKDFRGRVLYQHRQRYDSGFQLTGELGLISDRNFLEQYYEREWDQQKDQVTRLELKRLYGNQSLGIAGQVRLNDFFTQSEWLPRLDHFILGQPLFVDRVNWNAHSHVGYGRLKTADAPLDPNDGKFRLLPWEQDVEGVRAGTRHEVSAPFAAGPIKVVPYLLGDITYWEEALNQQSITRMYGQAGVRANLPIWKSDPTVQNELFNINGMTHKVDFQVDSFWADANEDLDQLALYDPLDDNAQERFRRRFAFDTFGGPTVPLQFDERYFALRRGMQNYVTSPSAEIADDLLLSRVGISQRWQTKRGFPGQRRIVDVVSLDVFGSVFPEEQRDNFGATLGMVDYDFRWNVGDRFAILSDGFFDLFSDGLRTASLGATTNRPELGSLYVGYRSIEGPITSNIVSGQVSYRMSEKWIASAGTSVDFGPTGNIGQTLAFTRIGESFLVKIGVRADASRGNFGAIVDIAPRFMPRNRQTGIDGVYVPPPGARGVE